MLQMVVQRAIDQGTNAEHSDDLKRVVVEMRAALNDATSAYSAIKNQEDASENDLG